MSTLCLARRWWRCFVAPNREPSENLGLPRSGEQERTPIEALVLSRTGKPGLVGNPIQVIGRARKSEDLPTVTPYGRGNCTGLRGEAGNGWQFFPARSFPILLTFGQRGNDGVCHTIYNCQC